MRRTILVGLLVSALVLAGVLSYLYYGATHGPGSIEVVMCPACEEAFTSYVRGGGDIVCALYDVGNKTGSELAKVGAHVVTDDESRPAYGTPYRHSGLMHNKFCVINDTVVITGSYNPTDGGSINKNNVVIVHSEDLARNYRRQYEALASNSRRGFVPHTFWVNGTRVENYFCPQDECEAHVLSALRAAHSEVLFMTYSFTSDPIGNLLLAKRSAGVHVEGICEQQQIDAYSECARLNASVYDNVGLLHHKVFVIDESVVVTGSYNPTSSGNKRNNENVLIIYDNELAQLYIQEYTAQQQGLYTGSER